jgi:hypothetical protein
VTDQPFKVLCSYAFFRTTDMRDLTGKMATPGTWVFGDSGAHSARTLGLHLTLEDYAAWCHRWDEQLTLYANLDVIGGPQATWDNQRRLELEHGLTPIPVFHTGDPWEWLERYIADGYTYIALGKLLGNPVPEVIKWLAKVFQIADGRAVFHGFGMTTWRVLREFPFYSVDSSTWGSSFRYGYLSLFDTARGQWVKVNLRDKAGLLQHRDLLRAHHADPAVFASRAAYNARHAAALAAVAWRRMELYFRQRHGLISIPDSPRNPISRHGAPSPPGLHLYLAEGSTTNLVHASHGATRDQQGTTS